MNTSGLSRERINRLHVIMDGYVERGAAPGLVTFISRRGTTSVDVIGTQELGGSQPMQRNTIFRLSSMTKPIIAVAAMLLVEECKLRLDEPVDRLLPELADRRVLRRLDGPLDDTLPAVRPITLRDLLTYRMGFGLIFGSPEQFPILRAMNELELGQGAPGLVQPPPPDEWLRRLGTLPLMHQPGEKWLYNTSSDVLGVLVARAAAQPLETFLRERIFHPLGMRDTSFSVPQDKIDRFATSYWTDPHSGALTLADPPAGVWSRQPAFPSGAGGLVSTVDDYVSFAQMLLNMGRYNGSRLLSRPSVALMTSDQLTPSQKAISGLMPGDFDHLGFGFGMAVHTQPHLLSASPGSYGWDGGLGTCWRNDPQEGMITLLMSQAAWTSSAAPNLCLDFWTSAYAAIDD